MANSLRIAMQQALKSDPTENALNIKWASLSQDQKNKAVFNFQNACRNSTTPFLLEIKECDLAKANLSVPISDTFLFGPPSYEGLCSIQIFNSTQVVKRNTEEVEEDSEIIYICHGLVTHEMSCKLEAFPAVEAKYTAKMWLTESGYVALRDSLDPKVE